MAINKLIFTGHCGRDMEVRHTPDGKAIGSVSVPCESGWGERKKTTWVECKIFGERAQKLAPHLIKGAAVTVAGRFEIETWTGKDGTERSRAVCIVDDIDFASSKIAGNAPASRERQQGNASVAGAAQNAPQSAAGGFDYDDDIPF